MKVIYIGGQPNAVQDLVKTVIQASRSQYTLYHVSSHQDILRAFTEAIEKKTEAILAYTGPLHYHSADIMARLKHVADPKEERKEPLVLVYLKAELVEFGAY